MAKATDFAKEEHACMCMCTHSHTHTRARTHTYTHTQRCTHPHIHIHTHTHTHTTTPTCTPTHPCIHCNLYRRTKQQAFTNTGDVSELLLVRHHVTAQCVNNGLNLEFLHFVYQGTQTATGKKRTGMRFGQNKTEGKSHKRQSHEGTVCMKGPRA